MNDTGGLAARIQRALRAVLPDGIKVAVHPRRGISATFDVRVRAGAVEHRFIAGWTAEGWPADVRRLAALVPDLDVIVAPDLSEGARGWLAEHDLGWADEAGRASMCIPSGLIVSREPAGYRLPRELPARWTRATVAAAEAALAGITPTVDAIERATGLSRGATANALAQLERADLLERSTSQRGPGSARRIADPGRLLDEYAAAAGILRAKEPAVLVHRLWTDALADLSADIAPALDVKGIDWAVTGTAASVMLAPYLSHVTVLDLYIRDALSAGPEQLAAILGGRVVERGHRIAIREAPTKLSTGGPVIDGIHLALPVRVYADLLAAGGRSAEAAHHLKETLHAGASA